MKFKSLIMLSFVSAIFLYGSIALAEQAAPEMFSLEMEKVDFRTDGKQGSDEGMAITTRHWHAMFHQLKHVLGYEKGTRLALKSGRSHFCKKQGGKFVPTAAEKDATHVFLNKNVKNTKLALKGKEVNNLRIRFIKEADTANLQNRATGIYMCHTGPHMNRVVSGKQEIVKVVYTVKGKSSQIIWPVEEEHEHTATS